MTSDGVRICEEGGRGFVFPVIATEYVWPPVLRTFLYTIAMIWLFIGVSIVADKFVAAIESVTAKKLRVKVRGQCDAPSPDLTCPDGQNKNPTRIKTVKLWNPTVANLTLMALGSSAPEILLSCVEVIGKGFHFRALGPSTIVGSAAFNLFCIISVCIMAIPSPDIRMIKEIRVFHVTAAFSIFAYLWLFFHRFRGISRYRRDLGGRTHLDHDAYFGFCFIPFRHRSVWRQRPTCTG
jgi:solute carrier family 8 (sodium/calcium exchanger)